jgi:hypothetical protein
LRGKITKRSVDALKLATDGAEAVLWDSELKGFGAQVQRGGAKSYVLHYAATRANACPRSWSRTSSSPAAARIAPHGFFEVHERSALLRPGDDVRVAVEPR